MPHKIFVFDFVGFGFGRQTQPTMSTQKPTVIGIL